MEKSADAFRTISEVADDLDLPQHVLRFWETRFPQIRPLKRAGGRRYYRPADVGLLRTIRALLYDEGYTIKGVQRLLKEQGARGIDAALRGAGLAAETIAPAEAIMGSADEDFHGETDLDDQHLPSHPSPQSTDEMQTTLHRAVTDPAALRSALAMLEECEHILRLACR